MQREPVIAARGGGLIGESGFVKNGIHEVPRGIAGERPAGAVRAMRARSEAENKNAGIGIAEAWHWLAPILPIKVGAALLAGDHFPVLNKARTKTARDDFSIQYG